MFFEGTKLEKVRMTYRQKVISALGQVDSSTSSETLNFAYVVRNKRGQSIGTIAALFAANIEELSQSSSKCSDTQSRTLAIAACDSALSGSVGTNTWGMPSYISSFTV